MHCSFSLFVISCSIISHYAYRRYTHTKQACSFNAVDAITTRHHGRVSQLNAWMPNSSQPYSAACRKAGIILTAGISIWCSDISTTLAIGSISELSKQSLVLQDVSFNIPNSQEDVSALQGLFQDKLKQLRQVTDNDRVLSVLGFGADAYNSPPTFIPGISDFQEDGAHCTITLRDKTNPLGNDEMELFNKGNGLEFVKVGVETLRLSKGIEKGAKVKYAYGWVDLDTPHGIPFNVVVGISRDPLMLAGIRVANVDKSVDFFTNKLDMQVSPFPLARQEGSNFEQPPPVGSVYVSYRGTGDAAATAGMGLLLIPSKGPINVGSQLEAFTIVVDDSDRPSLPAFVQALLKSKDESGAASAQAVSPDGYRFILKPYSVFAKEASESVPS